MRESREFAYLSADYEKAWTLRREVLLDPFSIEHEHAKNDDAQALHFGVFDEERCLACLFLVPRSPTKIQMRQVAVASALQRSGLGRTLVEFVEHRAYDRGYLELFAHARISAVPFYQRIGYQVSGSFFEQVGIPHLLVEKVLEGQKLRYP